MKVSPYIDQHTGTELFPHFPTSRHFNRTSRATNCGPTPSICHGFISFHQVLARSPCDGSFRKKRSVVVF
jgi:hypothetical protein